MEIMYTDTFTGESRRFNIPFTLVKGDKVEWVEVLPEKYFIPVDKRIVAARRAEAAGVLYRPLNEYEWSAVRSLVE